MSIISQDGSRRVSFEPQCPFRPRDYPDRNSFFAALVRENGWPVAKVAKFCAVSPSAVRRAIAHVPVAGHEDLTAVELEVYLADYAADPDFVGDLDEARAGLAEALARNAAAAPPVPREVA